MPTMFDIAQRALASVEQLGKTIAVLQDEVARLSQIVRELRAPRGLQLFAEAVPGLGEFGPDPSLKAATIYVRTARPDGTPVDAEQELRIRWVNGPDLPSDHLFKWQARHGVDIGRAVTYVQIAILAGWVDDATYVFLIESIGGPTPAQTFVTFRAAEKALPGAELTVHAVCTNEFKVGASDPVFVFVTVVGTSSFTPKVDITVSAKSAAWRPAPPSAPDVNVSRVYYPGGTTWVLEVRPKAAAWPNDVIGLRVFASEKRSSQIVSGMTVVQLRPVR
ncbi:hypothetical protein [Sorangium sp. So ce128]|uniref:hypothetical protein n=1 Tax=Sorangium sp. So ce128 TaxID=3133281 RepID=UPI003F5F3DC3